MTEHEEKAAVEKPKRRQVGRSPAYPFIDLEKALERAESLRKVEGKYEAPMTSAYDAWSLGYKSSGARQTAAALRYYGLIDVNGEAGNRRVKVSDLALRILLDQRDDKTERNKLIRESAITPAIHQYLMLEYPDGLPSDANVKHNLMFEKGFNEKSSDDVLTVFKATALYAGLLQSASMSGEKPDPVKAEFWATGEHAKEIMEREFGVPQQEAKPMQHTEATHSPSSAPPLPTASTTDIKIMLDGDFLRVSAVVDARGAKKLMRALKANIALLEDEEDGESEE